MKRRRIIYIFGSLLVGVIAALMIFIILLASGVVTTEYTTITITSLDSSKEYDGEVFRYDKYEIKEGKIKSEDRLVVRFTTNCIDAGTYSNDYEVEVYDSNNQEVTDNYRFKKSYGILEITRKTLNVNVSNLRKNYDGTPLKFTEKDFSYSENGLAKGDYIDLESLEFNEYITEPQKIYSKCSFNIYSPKRLNSNGTLKRLNENYNIVQNGGSQIIDMVNLTITTESLEKVYDGDPLTSEIKSFTCYPSIDTSRFEIVTPGWTSITNVGETINGPDASAGADITIYYVNNGTKKDVTDCFNITRNYGKLTVTQCVINATSSDIELQYNGADRKDDFNDIKESRKVITSNVPEGYKVSISNEELTESIKNIDDTALNKYTAVLVKKDGTPLTDEESGNFKINCTYGNLTISKINLEVYLEDYSCIYDGLEKNITTKPIIVGLLSGDTLDPSSYSYTYNQTPLNADTYKYVLNPKTLVINSNGAKADYYELPSKEVTGTITIKKETIVVKTGSVSADSDTVVSMSSPLACSSWEIVSGNVKGNDDLIVALTGALVSEGMVENTAVGFVRDGITKQKSNNYELEFQFGTLSYLNSYRYKLVYTIKSKLAFADEVTSSGIYVSKMTVEEFSNSLKFALLDDDNELTTYYKPTMFDFSTSDGYIHFVECNQSGEILSPTVKDENIKLSSPGTRYFTAVLDDLTIKDKNTNQDITSQFLKSSSINKLKVYSEKIDIYIPSINLPYGVYDFDEEYAKLDKSTITVNSTLGIDVNSIKVKIDVKDMKKVEVCSVPYEFVSANTTSGILTSDNEYYYIKVYGYFIVNKPTISFEQEDSIEIDVNSDNKLSTFVDKWFKTHNDDWTNYIAVSGLPDGYTIKYIGSNVDSIDINAGDNDVILNFAIFKGEENVSKEFDIEPAEVTITFIY